MHLNSYTMKVLILLLALPGIYTNSFSQSTLFWSEDFPVGLTNSYSDPPTIQTASDTIKVIGTKNTADGQRLLIVKYNLNGDTISTHMYGRDSVSNNLLIDYEFDSSNHVYLLQQERIQGFKSKIVVQKYSLDGTLIWIEQIQNPADTSYRPHALGLANDTSFFLTAHKEYDYPELNTDVYNTITLNYLYAYNSNGKQLWQRAFDPSTEISWFPYEDVFVHNNTAFLFADRSRLLKVDLENNMIVNSNIDLERGVNNVQLTLDNHLLITGRGFRISKIDLDGFLVWATSQASNTSSNEIYEIYLDDTGHIYVTGRINHNDRDADILTIMFDSDGNRIWWNRYDYGNDNTDIGYTLTLRNGNIYVGGRSQRLDRFSDSDYVVLKIDSINGDLNGVYRYNGVENGDDIIYSLHVFDNESVVLTGMSYIDSTYNWTTQFLADVISSTPSFLSNDEWRLFPNPIRNGSFLSFEGNEFVDYSIVSITGQIVQQGKLDGKDSNTLQINNVKTGIYLLLLKNDNQILTRKIMVE